MFSIPFSYATPCSQIFCYINYIGLFQSSVFFKNGELVDKSVGALPKNELEAKIKALI